MNLMLKYVFVSSSQAWAEWPELLENYFTLINTAAATPSKTHQIGQL